MSATGSAPGPSHAQARERFARSDVASRYPATYRDASARDRRERACILRCLEAVPAGAHVLDLPCGTGRLAGLLSERGYRVTAADSAVAMVRIARRNAPDHVRGGAELLHVVTDVMTTGFPDRSFDAVVCNRLFHHFIEPVTRRRALAELRRVSRGPIILSFFNSFALDAVYRSARDHLRGVTPTDRIPIPMQALESDLEAAGLRATRRLATRWGISPQWYVVATSA